MQKYLWANFGENEDGPLEFIRTLAGFYPDLICEIKSNGSDPSHVTSIACDSPDDPWGVKPLNFISQEFWVGPVDFIVGSLGLSSCLKFGTLILSFRRLSSLDFVFILLEVWYLDYIFKGSAPCF